MLLVPETAVVIVVAPSFFEFAKDAMCLVLLLQLRRKPIWQVCVWDAYFASTLLRYLLDKRLIGMLDWQVHHWEAFSTSA